MGWVGGALCFRVRSLDLTDASLPHGLPSCACLLREYSSTSLRPVRSQAMSWDLTLSMPNIALVEVFTSGEISRGLFRALSPQGHGCQGWDCRGRGRETGAPLLPCFVCGVAWHTSSSHLHHCCGRSQKGLHP